jgi:serine phosphatase RsbU (regulator of sigma subunit)
MIAPVLITSQGSRFIDAGGLPLGTFAGAVYQEQVVRLNPGDMLLLVSDGVVEAHNVEGELFGFERLEAVIAEAHPSGDVCALVELIIDRVHGFMGHAEQHDDITVVAVRPTLKMDATIPSNEEQATSYATV